MSAVAAAVAADDNDVPIDIREGGPRKRKKPVNKDAEKNKKAEARLRRWTGTLHIQKDNKDPIHTEEE